MNTAEHPQELADPRERPAGSREWSQLSDDEKRLVVIVKQVAGVDMVIPPKNEPDEWACELFYGGRLAYARSCVPKHLR